MRIISGKYRHRKLIWPEDNLHIRPTKDRIREAIFSSLGDIEDFNVLDLYAGSGALGIEALSRGSKYSLFVDINKVALKTIKTNLVSLDIPSTCFDVFATDDMSALKRCEQDNKVFDLIFLDPPYKEGKYEDVIDFILQKNLLSKNGIFVVESQRKLDLSSFIDFRIKEYNYGDINVYILRR